MIIEAFNCLVEKSSFLVQIDKQYYPCSFYTELDSCNPMGEATFLVGSTEKSQENGSTEDNEKLNDTLSFFQLIFVISTISGLIFIVFFVFLLKKYEQRPDFRHDAKDSYLASRIFRNIILFIIYIYIITNIFILILFTYDFSYIKKIHCFFYGYRC
jgi:uncharacterized protein YqhQ